MSNELLSYIERDSVIHRLNGATEINLFSTVVRSSYAYI